MQSFMSNIQKRKIIMIKSKKILHWQLPAILFYILLIINTGSAENNVLNIVSQPLDLRPQGKASVQKKTSHETTILPDIDDQYPGCKFKGNYIYAGAINLVWNEMKKNIGGEEVKLKTKDNNVLHFINIMNNFTFDQKDLDSNSYYIKSGFGQAVEDLINKEVMIKFPDKKLPKLDFMLEPTDLIMYAYIYKNLFYVNKFKPQNFLFDNQVVTGFFASTQEQKNTVEIIHYWTDDKFILKIKLKDSSDELILAKGFDQKNPIAVMSALNVEEKTTASNLGKSDVFGMPELHFTYGHVFKDLEYLQFSNQKFKNKQLSIFFEKVKFDLDYNGVRMENESCMIARTGAPPKFDKKLLLNKPFWLIIKKKESRKPYFILGINNEEFMKNPQKME